MEHAQDSPLQTDVNWDGVVVTVTMTGELDIATATTLSMSVRKVVAAHPQRLILDLSGLVFIDVAGARALDETYKVLDAECPVIVRQPRPSARKIFQLTGLMENYLMDD
jgi:anti-anti-sigma factor